MDRNEAAPLVAEHVAHGYVYGPVCFSLVEIELNNKSQTKTKTVLT